MLRSVAPPSVLPDISPTSGEISFLFHCCNTSTFYHAEAAPTLLISPPVGEMSGRTEGGNVEPGARKAGIDA